MEATASELYYEFYSKNYYDFINSFSQTEYESDKLLGRFYTDYRVSDEMASRVIAANEELLKRDSIKIIDPFCGDGRLIESIINELTKYDYSGKVQISIWDINKDAVKRARQKLLDHLRKNTMDADIEALCTDAFVTFTDHETEYDICVTNPPWGLLKPLKLFNSRCSEDELDTYKASIASYDEYMKGEFFLSMPTSKFGKWGTNLGRCGVEVALRIIKKDGVCGIVSPASLFNDQVSVPFRKWMFENHSIMSISYYPAELKLYGSADVSSITAVIKNGSTRKIDLLFYDKDFHYAKRGLGKKDIGFISQNGYTIPLESKLFRSGINLELKNCITLEEYCEKNNLKFVREMDETRVSEKLASSGTILFAKGYMVDRYSFSPEDKFLDESKVFPPDTVDTYKVVWRDVSRNSQTRRMKATMLNKGCIVGNSLGCISSKDGNTDNLAFILAVMNSYVFEYQAREKLVSNHVPVGVVRKVMIPNAKPTKALIRNVNKALSGSDNSSTLEVLVAKMYGISKDDFMEMVSGFTVDEKERARLSQVWEVDSI